MIPKATLEFQLRTSETTMNIITDIFTYEKMVNMVTQADVGSKPSGDRTYVISCMQKEARVASTWMRGPSTTRT